MVLNLQKFKLVFTDGTTETIETIGLWLAWVKGKLRAAEKGTVLLKVEPGSGYPHFSSSPATYYFDLPTSEKAVELETLLAMVSEDRARIRLVDRADYRVRVEAEIR